MRVWISGAVMLFCLAGCERLPTPPAGETESTSENRSASSSVTTTNVIADVATVAIPLPPPAPPAAPVSDEATLKQALALQAAGDLVAARNLLQPLADQPGASDALLTALGEINTRIVTTPVAAPEKLEYTIVGGDSLGKIASQHHVTLEFLKQSNHLSRDLIRAGDRLRIYQGEFAVTVDKTDNTLTLTDHGRFFKRYPVGTGEYSKTPVGQFQITSRVVHPIWWRGDRDVPYGDPENILGTHWLGLDIPGYGIHGTWDNAALGKQSTAGCVRLRNDDVAELYMLLPTGTPVTIRE